MTPTPNAMRLAFESATSNVHRTSRTRLYAMVRSALSRRLGLTRRHKLWSVAHGRR